MCVTSMGKTLIKIHNFCSIRKFILEKNHVRVKTVTIHQVMAHSLLSVKKPLQVVNPTNVMSVAKVSAKSFVLLNIKRPIPGNTTNVPNARQPSISKNTSFDIRKCMLQKLPVSVRNVGRLSGGDHCSLNISLFTLEKTLLSVMTVGDPSNISLP